jgi:hypothetical protein
LRTTVVIRAGVSAWATWAFTCSATFRSSALPVNTAVL